MRIMAILSMFVLANTSWARDFNATIDDIFCGEMDPYVVGDVCVISLTKEDNSKIAIVMDIDDFSTQFDEYDLQEGLEVIIDSDSLSQIQDADVIDVLRDYDSNYFYLEATDLELTVLDAVVVSKKRMKEFIEKTSGNFSARNLPAGYKAVKVKTPTLKRSFVTYLQAATHFKESQWKQFVLKSDEYGHLNYDQRLAIAKNPKKELGVKYLLEVDEVYEIYRGNQFIGYFMDVTDHVQAAIYQDGAWIDMFLDIEMNVLLATDESA